MLHPLSVRTPAHLLCNRCVGFIIAVDDLCLRRCFALGSFGRRGLVSSCVFVLLTGSLLNRPRSLQVRRQLIQPERVWLLFPRSWRRVALFLSIPESPISSCSAKYGCSPIDAEHEQPRSLSVGATGQPLITTPVTAEWGHVVWDAQQAWLLVFALIATWLVNRTVCRGAPWTPGWCSKMMVAFGAAFPQ